MALRERENADDGVVADAKLLLGNFADNLEAGTSRLVLPQVDTSLVQELLEAVVSEDFIQVTTS
jgi:hypothetical protein